MGRDLWVARYEKGYRDSADKLLFDILKINWNPSYDELEKFCEKTTSEIIDKYKELENTKEYIFTGQILTAKNHLGGETLAFLVGGGTTEVEICSTHGLEWEIQRLLDSQKVNSQPFDLKLLIAGYRGGGGRGGGQPLPVFEEVVGF